MTNQVDKEIDNDMEAGMIWGLYRDLRNSSKQKSDQAFLFSLSTHTPSP